MFAKDIEEVLSIGRKRAKENKKPEKKAFQFLTLNESHGLLKRIQEEAITSIHLRGNEVYEISDAYITLIKAHHFCGRFESEIAIPVIDIKIAKKRV
jgi:hypothetical protein